MSEAGYFEALWGLGLSHGLTAHLTIEEFKQNNKLVQRLHKVASTLTPKDKGHNKFLESLVLWISVDAPRYWWSEADTYRLTSKQSESTMHKQELRFQEYEPENEEERLFLIELQEYQLKGEKLFNWMKDKNIEFAKAAISEGLLQKREWRMDYKTLKNVLQQRENHKLKITWRENFYSEILKQVKYPEFLRYAK